MAVMQNQHFLSAIVVVAVVITASQKTTVQNIGINNDNPSPHSSAMPDIKNPNKGILVPRIVIRSVLQQSGFIFMRCKEARTSQ
jgi:hypothetical protein